MPDETPTTKLGRVAWRMRGNGVEGHGAPIDISLAHAHVAYLNARHYDIDHWVEPVLTVEETDGWNAG